MTGKHDKAWGDFWSLNSNNPAGGGCLPAGWKAIDAAQRNIWANFAEQLPRKANLLDVATGDGRVMRWLLQSRSDLKPVGVDMAPQLPPPPKGTKLRAGVAMEEMPFSNGKFQAITSQFGFEYGDVPKTAKEFERLLADGGVIGLITHRIDGPILAHNLARSEQIHWALKDQELVEIAKRNLKLRATGIPTVSPKLNTAPVEGARLFGQGSAGWEIAEAVRQTMVLGLRDHPQNVARLLDTLVERAENELGRIASLQEACGQTADQAGFQSALDNAGLEQADIETIHDDVSAKPFADFRLIRRKN